MLDTLFLFDFIAEIHCYIKLHPTFNVSPFFFVSSFSQNSMLDGTIAYIQC